MMFFKIDSPDDNSVDLVCATTNLEPNSGLEWTAADTTKKDVQLC